jgi:acetate kinase
MASCILVLNCGSSSIKFALIDPNDKKTIVTGIAEKLNLPSASLKFSQNGEKQVFAISSANHNDAMQNVLNELAKRNLLKEVFAIGHRVVHGGEQFQRSQLINGSVLEAIKTCSKLAPLHNPANLLGIENALKYFPNLPQVAVFDTSFHQTIPKKAYLYAIPMKLHQQHSIRRYGFHGISYRFVCQEAARMINKPLQETALIVAHLGNGSSITAILNGQSVDTSMGLTPLEGLVMGTRSGDIDPGITAFLADNLNMSIATINNLLNKESGLLGLSELTSDCRELEEAALSGHEGATLALEIFCYRLAKYIAGYVVPLGRIDALVFTGGIGENSDILRAAVLSQLNFLGITLDVEANKRCIRGIEGRIDQGTDPAALVVATNEELMIALDTAQLI